MEFSCRGAEGLKTEARLMSQIPWNLGVSVCQGPGDDLDIEL